MDSKEISEERAEQTIIEAKNIPFKKSILNTVQMSNNYLCACSWALFLVIIGLFHNATAVGNNFDHERFYVFYLILPALAVLLGTMVLQKFFAPKIILTAIFVYESITLFAFSFTAINFELVNADNLMYIYSYMMIYEGPLFFALLAGVPSLLYLSFIERIECIRKESVPYASFLEWFFRQFLIAMALSAMTLYLADFWALGMSHIVYAMIFVGCGVHAMYSPEITMPLQHDSPILGGAPRPRMPLKNIALGVALLLLSLAAGYFWPIDFIRYGQIGDTANATIWIGTNDRQILHEFISSATITIIVGITCYPAIRKGIQRFCKQNDMERRAGLMSITILALIFALFNLGFKLEPIRASSLLIPWFLFFLLAWITIMTLQRNQSKYGVLGATLCISILGGWGGLCLGAASDSDYEALYFGAGLMLSILIFVFIYYYYQPRILRKHASEVASNSPVKNSESKKLRGSNYHLSPQVKKATAISVMILTIIIPTIYVSYQISTQSEFQILANVDNNCIFYLADPMTRIDKNFKPGFGLADYQNVDNRISISAARNEYLSIQIVMLPINTNHYSLYETKFSSFIHEIDGSVINNSHFKSYVVEYIEALSNVLPDRLVEFYPFATADGSNHPIWLTFYIPSNATAGSYKGTVTFSVDNQTNPYDWYTRQAVEFEVNLQIFDFTLPGIPSLKSNFGLWNTPSFDDLITEFQTHRMMHWAFFDLPNCTLNPDGSINAINFPEMINKYNEIHTYGTYTIGFHFSPYYVFRNDLFVVGGDIYDWKNYSTASTYDATFTQYFDLLETELKSHSYIDYWGNTITWFDDTYMNSRDEIQAAPIEERLRVLAEHDWLKNKVGMTIPIMQTMMGEEPHPDIQANIDIICIHTMGQEPKFITDWKKAGKEVWIYTTRGPRFPSPSISTGGFATQVRALAWQCWIYNYSQYLIWDVITPNNANGGYGYQGWNGGSLFYTMSGGYALSTRLENWRDGCEDYDYFTFLRNTVKYLQNMDPSNEKITEGQRLLNEVNNLMEGETPIMDYRVVNQLRYEIGLYIAAAGIWS